MSDSTTSSMPGRAIETQPSETALATATLRALATYDVHNEVRGADTLAELFLTEDRRAPLKDPAARRWVLQNKTSPGAYEFMIARTAFLDQLVQEALRENIPQIVFLGAGYDSRPYRFRELVGDARLFELDAPPTQQRKREILAQAGVLAPEGLTYVGLDFETGDLKEALGAAGFSPMHPALFIWEGVSYYLSLLAVDRLLAAVYEIAAKDSSIAFDYACLSAEALGDSRVQKLRQQMKTSHAGEPTRFGIPAGQVGAFLARRGYEISQHLSPAELEQRYLCLQDGSLLGKSSALLALVQARVKKE
jgi:methyltransferase (TIGR00027 family)